MSGGGNAWGLAATGATGCSHGVLVRVVRATWLGEQYGVPRVLARGSRAGGEGDLARRAVRLTRAAL